MAKMQKARKILKTSAKIGALTFTFVGLFPGCNLMAPSCDEPGASCYSDDLPIVDPRDLAAPDLSDKDKS
jgi:hypothetical protein